MPENNLFYLLALQRAPLIGDITAKKLISKCGSAEAIFREKPSNLLKIENIGNYTIRSLFKKDNLLDAEKELEYISKHKVTAIDFMAQEYPVNLKQCADGPLLIFTEGKINFKQQKIVSVVGTRQATAHGLRFCKELIEELSVLDPVIVSGFAYGIDIAAHKAAIDQGLQTIGCLAHGLPFTYPARHRIYRDQVKKRGGFVTDFWSGDPPERNNFLRRNRIIAGLADATLVIESADKGGSLVTADIAHSYDREVFAAPGRYSDRFSAGCNSLIKQQKAHLLTCAADLLYIMGWDLNPDRTKGKQTALFPELEKSEQQVVGYLEQRGKAMADNIAMGCEMPVQKTLTLLLSLEMKGVVQPLPGKQYELIR